MEVVSTLCFGSHTTPEPALIKMLMETVFTEDKSMKSLLSHDRSEAIPVIKSSFLQLLLEHE